MKLFQLLFCGLFICLTTSIGQSNHKYWIDGGLGNYYSTDNTSGFAYNLSANYIHDSALFKLRFLNITEFQVFSPDFLETFNSIGFLFGKGFSNKYIQLYLSGGIGVTSGVKRNKFLFAQPTYEWGNISIIEKYEKEKFISPSIPLEIELIFKPERFMGIGVSLWADFNYKRPMFGVIGKFGIGKLR